GLHVALPRFSTYTRAASGAPAWISPSVHSGPNCTTRGPFTAWLVYGRARAPPRPRRTARAGRAHPRLVHAAGGSLAPRVPRGPGALRALRDRAAPGALR